MKIKHSIILICLFATLIIHRPSAGQDGKLGQDQLSKLYQQKIDEPWLKSGGWLTDLGKAKAEAKNQGKNILIYVGVSHSEPDACKIVELDLLSSKEFNDWSASYVKCAIFQSKIAGKTDDNLHRDLRITDYPPCLALLSNEGEVLAKLTSQSNYADDALGYVVENLEPFGVQAAKYTELCEKARQGDVESVYKKLMDDLQVGRISYAKADLTFALHSKSLSEEMQRQLLQQLIDFQYSELRKAIFYKQEAMFEKGIITASEYDASFRKLKEDFFHAGRIPTGGDGALVCWHMMQIAKKKKDLALYDRAESKQQYLLSGGMFPNSDTREGAKDKGKQPNQGSANQDEDIKGSDQAKTKNTIVAAAKLLLSRQEKLPDGIKLVTTKNSEPISARWKPKDTLSGWQERERLRIKKFWSGNHGCAWSYSINGNVLGIAATAIVSTALVQASDIEPAMDDNLPATKRSIRFLLDQVQQNIRDFEAYDCAYTLEFFLRIHQDEKFGEFRSEVLEAIPKLINRLNENESGWPAGGWNYGVTMGPCAPFTTGITLLSLYHAKARGFSVDEDVMNRALTAMEKCKLGRAHFGYDGGYRQLDESNPYFEKHRHMHSEKGSIGRSPVAVLSLYLAGQAEIDDVRFAIHKFFEHLEELRKHKSQSYDHDGITGIGPHYFMFAHVYAAKAIEALPEDERPELRRKLRESLMRSMDDDGGWNDTINPRNKSYGTAMAIIALTAPHTEKLFKWQRAADQYSTDKDSK